MPVFVTWLRPQHRLRIGAKRIGRARAWEAEIASVSEFTVSDLRILWPVAANLEAVAERLHDAPSRRIGAPSRARCQGGVATTSPTVVARGATGCSAMSPTCPVAPCLTGPESGSGATGKCTDPTTGDHGDLLDLIARSEGLDRVRDGIEEARSFLSL
jgi:hypothetical protein